MVNHAHIYSETLKTFSPYQLLIIVIVAKLMGGRQEGQISYTLFSSAVAESYVATHTMTIVIVYFYILCVDGKIATKKMLYVSKKSFIVIKYL